MTTHTECVGTKPAGRKKHWPRAPDFRPVTRSSAISLVDAYIDVVGLSSLQCHRHFTRVTFSRAAHLDDGDLREGIAAAIYDLANRDLGDQAEHELWKRLEAACGPFHKPAAFKVGMWKMAIMP